MTSYHIYPGYNSGHAKADVWAMIRAEAATLRHDHLGLVDEALREQPSANRALLAEYAQSYTGDQDKTIFFREADSDGPGEVVQWASGGGEARDVKELLRRAFCRRLIFAMHRHGMEVNLVVA